MDSALITYSDHIQGKYLDHDFIESIRLKHAYGLNEVARYVFEEQKILRRPIWSLPSVLTACLSYTH